MADLISTRELQFSIPSVTVQTHILFNEIYLIHLQRAIFIYHSDQPIQEKERYLKKIQDETKDHELKSQIQEVINHNDKKIKAFKDNHDNKCIYILYIIPYTEGPIVYGYFQNAEVAIARGLAISDAFFITKVTVWESLEESLEKDKYLSKVVYRNYKLYECWVPELAVWYDENHFTNKFCEVPNPFSRGDIVITVDGKLGIVETIKTSWDIYVKQDIDSKGYEDASLHVLLIDGYEYASEKISPLRLNMFDLDRTDLKLDNATKQRLINLRNIYKGEGSLEPILDSLYEEDN